MLTSNISSNANNGKLNDRVTTIEPPDGQGVIRYFKITVLVA